MDTGQGKDRGLKLASCLCFVLLAAALLLIDRHSPATGYELSVYESLPAAAWICLIASLAGGTVIVVHQAFAERKSSYWLLGFLVLILGVSVLLLLPILRGYFFYGSGDAVTHWMWANEILSDKHFSLENRYPMTHILIAQSAQVTGLAAREVVQWIPAFFTVLFMLFGYLLAASVLPRKGQALLAAASTALFFNYYHVTVYPQGLSVMMLPMVFYLYFKASGGSSLPFRIAFVTLLLLFPYSHPAPAGVLIVSLLAAECAKVAWRMRERSSAPVRKDPVDRISLGPTLISSVTFLTWISSYAIFATTIRRTFEWLTGEVQAMPHVEKVERLLQAQALGLSEQVSVALKMYGDNLIYLFLCTIALLMVAWQFLRKQGEAKRVSLLCTAFMVSGPAWVLIFATTMRVTVGRLLGANIMMWATSVLAAFALWEMFARWNKIGIVIVTVILLCASILGIFGVYQSPYILQASWQVTRQDAQGSSWFRDYANLPTPDFFVNLGVAPEFAGAGGLRVPDHFGLPRYQTPGEALPPNAFVLLGQRSRLCSTDPALTRAKLSPCAEVRFWPSDFERLELDRSVNWVYANGEMDVLTTGPEPGV